MELDRLVGLILDGNYEESMRLLRAETDQAALKLIEGVRKVRDPEVRLWICWAAPTRLGTAAAPLLRDMALHDRHSDVSDEARHALMEIEPESAAQFWPRLRRRLGSSSLWDAEHAGWQLFKLGDPLLKEEIAKVLPHWPPTDYIHKSFQVLDWCIDGRVDQIEAHIRNHDHELMRWLSRSAVYLASGELWSAVEWAAESAPDERCRRDCAKALEHRPSNSRGGHSA
jgi:hypothetical protein